MGGRGGTLHFELPPTLNEALHHLLHQPRGQSLIGRSSHEDTEGSEADLDHPSAQFVDCRVKE